MSSKIMSLLIALPAVIIAIGLHEAAHAFMAYKLGDNTAKNMGRLTVNPLKHIDPIGFICLFLFHFGWAKPVPINPNNFKGNKKRGIVLTALAGPVMNIIVAFVFAIILYVVAAFAGNDAGTFTTTALLMIYYVVVVNVSLAVFNLIPVPPLDGSKIFGGFLPYKYFYKMEEYQNIITIIMMLLLFTGVLGMIISPVSDFLINIIDSAARFIVGSALKLFY